MRAAPRGHVAGTIFSHSEFAAQLDSAQDAQLAARAAGDFLSEESDEAGWGGQPGMRVSTRVDEDFDAEVLTLEEMQVPAHSDTRTPEKEGGNVVIGLARNAWEYACKNGAGVGGERGSWRG